MSANREETPGQEIALFLRQLKWLVVVAASLWLIGLLGPILTPFVLGALLGWLGDPLADRLQRRGLSRNLAVGLVFGAMVLVVVLALLILVPLLERQIVTLIESAPEYRDWILQTALPWLEQKTGLDLVGWLDTERLTEWVKTHWTQAGGFAATVFGYLSRSGVAMLAWVANIVLLPILTFYFLRDWDMLVDRVAALVPRDHLGTVTRLARESNDVLGAFLRGQFVVMIALGLIYAIGLSLVGLKLGLLIGVIAGFISFIPYLGATTGVVLALVAALVQSQGFDLQLLVLVGVVFTVGQMLESYVLTPRIVGDKIGLHPMAVIFAIMAGGQLFGFVGMLLALPVAAVANVLLRFAKERYRESDLYTGEHAVIVLDSYVDPSTVEQVASREPEQS
ncbi:AI-2E family transporter [Pseudoxanthomonas daejeonensis]|uniref:AI-2E family transporter n=1 Tax=Pseudoxanthomonas daejeonensis TaxID=266062 RepID=UPI001EE3EB33|nr:AI-2E family transporter [Pseudoxanthomonas daejeonensis]